MSLLMDALKKAELAKRQGGDAAKDDLAGDEPAPPLAFPDLPSADDIHPPEPPPLPPLPSRLEALAEQRPPAAPQPQGVPHSPLEFAPLDPPATRARVDRGEPALRDTPPEPFTRPDVAARPSQRPPVVEQTPSARGEPAKPKEQAQDDAKNLFAAKGAEPPSRRKNLFPLVVGAATLLATLGIGGYFWMQLQPKTGLGPLAGTPRPSTPAAAPAGPAAVTAPAASPAAQATVTAPSVTPSGAAADPATPASGIQAAVDAVKRLAQTPATSETAKAVPRRPAADTRDADAESRLFVPTKVPLRVNSGVARGYEAFERGDLAAARQEYERVLKTEPQNVDALLGVAAIALKLNRPEEADHYYQKVLISDPQEPTAISALAGLRARINPAAAEQRLKTLAAATPELAAPQLALGALYAGQERWAEAQQAYFSAYAIEPSNADVLFNLAVSLEHLRQPRLAAQYYGLAVEAAARRPGNFDTAQAQARLRALQP